MTETVHYWLIDPTVNRGRFRPNLLRFFVMARHHVMKRNQHGF